MISVVQVVSSLAVLTSACFGDVDLVLIRGALFRGLVTIVPSGSRVDRLRVSRTPWPGPPASSSFFAWRAMCLASRSGLVKMTAHRGHVSRPFPWLRACLRRCSALVKLGEEVNLQFNTLHVNSLPSATTRNVTNEAIRGPSGRWQGWSGIGCRHRCS